MKDSLKVAIVGATATAASTARIANATTFFFWRLWQCRFIIYIFWRFQNFKVSSKISSLEFHNFDGLAFWHDAVALRHNGLLAPGAVMMPRRACIRINLRAKHSHLMSMRIWITADKWTGLAYAPARITFTTMIFHLKDPLRRSPTYNWHLFHGESSDVACTCNPRPRNRRQYTVTCSPMAIEESTLRCIANLFKLGLS